MSVPLTWVPNVIKLGLVTSLIVKLYAPVTPGFSLESYTAIVYVPDSCKVNGPSSFPGSVRLDVLVVGFDEVKGKAAGARSERVDVDHLARRAGEGVLVALGLACDVALDDLTGRDRRRRGGGGKDEGIGVRPHRGIAARENQGVIPVARQGRLKVVGEEVIFGGERDQVAVRVIERVDGGVSQRAGRVGLRRQVDDLARRSGEPIDRVLRAGGQRPRGLRAKVSVAGVVTSSSAN